MKRDDDGKISLPADNTTTVVDLVGGVDALVMFARMLLYARPGGRLRRGGRLGQKRD